MSPSKESLERAVKWLRDQAGIMRLQGDFVPSQRESLADLLDEAIREARRAEAGALATPYPEDIFTPLGGEEEMKAIRALNLCGVANASDRLHAHWARHLSEVRLAQLREGKT